MSAGADELWLLRPAPRAEARLRLFCFPYAGGTPNVFRSWAERLPEDIELIGVRLPGRDMRLREKAFTDWTLLLDATEEALLPHFDKPFAFFGHSFGARIAFELTKQLEARKLPLPEQLFLSGCRSPHIPPPQPILHVLPREEFFERLRVMNGTPAEVLQNQTLMRMLEPTMRADMQLSELWRNSPRRVRVPIAAFSGAVDPIDPPPTMSDWGRYTSASFSFHVLEGDHFFLHSREEELLETLSAQLQRVLENPATRTIPQLFEEQVQRSPDAVALIYKEERLTYRELNERANRLAHHLIQLGCQADSLVGLCVERGFDLVTGMLAILKAGGAYLPLDAGYPQERLTHMMTEADVRVLVTQQRFLKALPTQDVRVVVVDEGGSAFADQSVENPPPRCQAQNLAYVNYTSGSTGLPKGVETPHRGVTRLLFGGGFARIDSTRTFLQLAPVSFDAATFEVWGPLLHGGRCVLFEEKLPRLQKVAASIEKNGVTTLFLTTALFNTIIDENPKLLAPVKQVLTGGEAHSVRHMRRALSELPDTEIFNVYGPTESTTFATFFPVRGVEPDAASIPIGGPIGHTLLYVLDEQLQPVPVGAVGELYIGGEGLARGYLRQPELTQQKFVSDLPFLPPGERLYKTGDLVQYRSDGTLDFAGRVDEQVKIHGFRIEPGEIEAQLITHPRVRQASVVVHERTYSDKRLIAFLVGEGEQPSSQALRTYLQGKLPSYMVPAAFHWLEELPLTPHGKVNRKELVRLAESTGAAKA